MARGARALKPAPRQDTPDALEGKLSGGIYAQIFERILAGEYPMNARLPAETELARRFGASRPVVREALARLREDGVIVSRQGSGSYVKRRPDSAILRFVPVWQRGAPYEGAWNSSYGPPGPLPPTGDVRSGLTPPASAPKIASRSVPVPKPSPLAAKQAAEPAKPAAESAAKPAPEPSTQQATAAQVKLADPGPATTATIGQTVAKPAPGILPTQDMPKAQGLE